MSEQNGLVDLTRQLAVLEELTETMNERYDKGWKLLEAKMAEDAARLREDIAKRDTEMARRDKNMSIHLYAVGFGILVVIISIGGTIISLLV